MIDKERLDGLVKKINNFKDKVNNEQQTKNVMIEPLLALLGYHTSNPEELLCEYTADYGIKQGEKVDYALFNEYGELIIIVEAKRKGTILSEENKSQLFRYYSVSGAKLGILTNGEEYNFYTDLNKDNIMDNDPFYSLDINKLTKDNMEFLSKLTRETYDIDKMREYIQVRELRYKVNDYFNHMVIVPDREFVEFIRNKFNGQGIDYGIISDIIKNELSEVGKWNKKVE